MPEPFIAEIKLVPFAFAPRGWALCNGQLLPINQNQALFSLLGTNYGGNGQTNFALPDLRDRTIIGLGGPSTAIGQRPGVNSFTLNVATIPAHAHMLNVSGATATVASPIGAHLATAVNAVGTSYSASANASNSSEVLPTGGNQPHENRQPFLTMNYIIALEGIFPSRN